MTGDARSPIPIQVIRLAEVHFEPGDYFVLAPGELLVPLETSRTATSSTRPRPGGFRKSPGLATEPMRAGCADENGKLASEMCASAPPDGPRVSGDSGDWGAPGPRWRQWKDEAQVTDLIDADEGGEDACDR